MSKSYHYEKRELTPEEKARKEENKRREANRKRGQKWIEHNKEIMEDNISFGLKYPADYSRAEFDAYIKEERKRQKEFVEFVLSGGTPIYDKTTEMWVVPQNQLAV